MRIPCPFCGERSFQEFAYHGDAKPMRPSHGDATAWFEYVYLRDNPAGPHEELWYHAAGCRSWLVVTRDTTTHDITGARPARDIALERSAAP